VYPKGGILFAGAVISRFILLPLAKVHFASGVQFVEPELALISSWMTGSADACLGCESKNTTSATTASVSSAAPKVSQRPRRSGDPPE
jgi:hypothetical protein